MLPAQKSFTLIFLFFVVIVVFAQDCNLPTYRVKHRALAVGVYENARLDANSNFRFGQTTVAYGTSYWIAYSGTIHPTTKE